MDTTSFSLAMPIMDNTILTSLNLITGHSGFIGSHLFEDLGGDGIDLKDGQDIRTFDFQNPYKTIFHAAAQASIPLSFEQPLESHTHNVVGTLRVLEYAKKIGANVVFCSSSSIYDMMSPYAFQKYECEKYMEHYWRLGVKSCALRYFNVFGERQELANGGYTLVLSRFLKQYKNREPFTIVGTGKQRRDFIYIKDVVEANRLAAQFLETAEGFEVFDIGYGENHSVNELAKMIDPKHKRVKLPPRIEPFENLADTKKAQELLGWSPKVSVEQWIKSQV